MRGDHPNVILHKDGYCKAGHIVDLNNSYRRSDGRPRCAECHRANAAIARNQ